MREKQMYGYVRVSTKEQNESRQVIAMRAFGVSEKNIVVEKVSGKDFNRPQYKRLIKKLKQGDTLVVKSIDRLGRNYEEIIEQWRKITKEIEAMIAVIDMPLLDTRQKTGESTSPVEMLTHSFISDLVLQILSYVAQMERSFNQQRQAEGIAAAKAKGVKFGRKTKERPPQFFLCRELWQLGKISAREAARLLGISHPTFLSWAKEN